MKSEEAITLLSDTDLLDKLYAYSYKRCSSSHEAEDLCSDIVLALMKALRRDNDIDSFYAYVWAVAHKTYADFCEKRKKNSDNLTGIELSECAFNLYDNNIEEYHEALEDRIRFRTITREISFLSKIYRDVMVMYYLDGMNTVDIATGLGISETAVKQRLFSARNTIKKEVCKMDTRNLTLKPVKFICHGDGDPVKSYPFSNTTRAFSQSVLYLCKDRERSAKEISESLNVPLPFVEEELEIQCNGTNGRDGMLKRLGNGKYISTFIMLDYNDYQHIRSLLCSYLDKFTDRIQDHIKANKEIILSFPFLNKQDDIRFILWSLVNRMCWHMGWELSNTIEAKYYSGLNHDEKDYYPFVYAVNPDTEWKLNCVGCDGITGYSVGGYSYVHLCNIYDGFRKEAHFHCGLNISTTPYILLTLRSIGGLDVSVLTEDERETAAKAIENGFLKRDGDILSPRILVFKKEDENAFYSLASSFAPHVTDFAEELSEGFNELIKKYLPKHLYGQVDKFISHTTSEFDSDVLDKCIERGILYKPESLICPEGTYMIVDK